MSPENNKQLIQDGSKDKKYQLVPATVEAHRVIKLEAYRLGITLVELMDMMAVQIESGNKRSSDGK